MKALTIAGVSILALALILGAASPVLAAPDLAPPKAIDMPPKMLAGKVINIDENQEYFVIQSWKGEVTISVDDNTQYFNFALPCRAMELARERMELRQQSQEKLGPWNLGLARFSPALRMIARAKQRVEAGQQEPERQARQNLPQLHHFGEEATFDDIAIDTWVAVRLAPEEDNSLAELVLIMTPASYHCVTGTVTSTSLADKTITIAPADGGDDIILNYNESTRFMLHGIIELEEGQSIRAIYDKEMTAKVVFASIEV